MEFVPKQLNENVNVSKVHPLKEIFILFFGITFFIVFVYLLLGLMIEYSIKLAPVEIEQTLAKYLNKQYVVLADNEYDSMLNEMVASLKTHVEKEVDYYEKIQVKVVKNNERNAFALPGGVIIVNSGLLESAEYEDEIIFVLAHEMGHFAARDNLKGIGRGVVFISISVVLLGSDSAVTNILLDSLKHVEFSFSREQEMNADFYALELMNRTYGNTNGALLFMEKMEKSATFVNKYFSTHPLSKTRLLKMQNRIKEKKYPLMEMKKITVTTH